MMLSRIQQSLKRDDAPFDAIVISNLVNLRWATGFTGSYGTAVVTADQGWFVTDSRYRVQAKDQVKDLEVISFGSPQTFNAVFAELLQSIGCQKVGFEESISYNQWRGWTGLVSSIDWVPAGTILSDLRKIKTPEEISRIREACKLADACMEHALRMVRPGVTEYDIALDIEFFFKRQGASPAFEPIVVSGVNSAKPHGRGSEKPLENGDFVTLDLGGMLDGYNSDITRTVVVGKASDRHREIYHQVLRAEEECCQMLIAGSNGNVVDAHARKILDEKGLAQYFGHSLGHGLGADVHDPGRLHETADEPLHPNMVFTVEPGVYIDGFGGVRIEDDVLITENGPEVLTHLPRALLEIS